jgi:hypothetical protein
MVVASNDWPHSQANGEELSASPINSSGITEAMQQISIPRSIAQTEEFSVIARSHWDDGRRPPPTNSTNGADGVSAQQNLPFGVTISIPRSSIQTL